MEDLLPSAGDPLRGWGGHQLLRIRKRKRSGPERESEGFINGVRLALLHYGHLVQMQLLLK